LMSSWAVLKVLRSRSRSAITIDPHREDDGRPIVDDIDVPTSFSRFRFLSEDAMFECAEVVRTTGFFHRTDAAPHSPVGDGGHPNRDRHRFPVQDPAIATTRTDPLGRRVPARVRRAAWRFAP